MVKNVQTVRMIVDNTDQGTEDNRHIQDTDESGNDNNHGSDEGKDDDNSNDKQV